MPSTTYDKRPTTNAVIAMLATVLTPLVNRTKIHNVVSANPPGPVVGDGKAPALVAGEEVPRYPYIVVRSLGGGDIAATWGGDGMAGLIYQVTSVGDERDQCEWMADLVRKAFMDLAAVGYAHAITPTEGAAKVIGRAIEAPGFADPQGVIWNFVEQYRLTVSIF